MTLLPDDWTSYGLAALLVLGTLAMLAGWRTYARFQREKQWRR